MKTETNHSARPPQSEDFWRLKTLDELAAEQGVNPVANPEELKADFWPEDETADEIVSAIRTLRKEGRIRSAS